MASTQGSNNLIWAKGRGRGKRPNQPFSPSRRPGEKSTQKASFPAATAGERSTEKPSFPGVGANPGAETKVTLKPEALKTKPETTKTTDEQSVFSKGQNYLAKYNYKANTQSPLGQEACLAQGEKVRADEKHKDNSMWWRVTKSTGESGFVPAKYLHKVEEKISALPWLANKQLDADEDCPPPGPRGPPKAYVSAYNKPEKEEVQKKQYYCNICEKDFNGPRPFSSHMVSKAHKLEVELAEERDSYDAANS